MKRWIACCTFGFVFGVTGLSLGRPPLIDPPSPPPCAADGSCYPNTCEWGYTLHVGAPGPVRTSNRRHEKLGQKSRAMSARNLVRAKRRRRKWKMRPRRRRLRSAKSEKNRRRLLANHRQKAKTRTEHAESAAAKRRDEPAGTDQRAGSPAHAASISLAGREDDRPQSGVRGSSCGAPGVHERSAASAALGPKRRSEAVL